MDIANLIDNRCLSCGYNFTSKEHLERVQYCYFMLHNSLMDLKKTEKLLHKLGLTLSINSKGVTKNDC